MNIFKALGVQIIDFLKPIVTTPSKTQYSDCIIYNPKGQILLLHRTYTDDFMNGKWGLPGGHVDPGEDPTVAAAREALEETGLTVTPTLIDIKVKKDCIIYYYEATLTSDSFDPNDIVLDIDEHRGWEWVNPSDISQYDLILDLGTYLPNYLKLQPLSQDIITLDSSWLTLQDAFDNDLITEEEFLKARDQYLKLKKAEALSIIAKGFDEGLVSEEDYLKVIQTNSDYLQKGGKQAFIGEKRTFGGREYVKTANGWKFHGKGTGTKAKEHVASTTDKKIEQMGKVEHNSDETQVKRILSTTQEHPYKAGLALAELKGYLKEPTIVDTSEYKAIKGLELHTGLNAGLDDPDNREQADSIVENYINQFKTGKYHTSSLSTIYASGMNFSTDKLVAKEYADGGSDGEDEDAGIYKGKVISIKIKDPKICTRTIAQQLATQYSKQYGEKVTEWQAAILGGYNLAVENENDSHVMLLDRSQAIIEK